MAHYKRGKCRYHCPNAIRGSLTSWRAKHGMHPARIDWSDIPDWRNRKSSAEWDAMWHPRGQHGNRGKKISGPYSTMASYPAWWDRLFHTRPRRAREKLMTKAILAGKLDADNIAWPLAKKPHIWYW